MKCASTLLGLTVFNAGFSPWAAMVAGLTDELGAGGLSATRRVITWLTPLLVSTVW